MRPTIVTSIVIELVVWHALVATWCTHETVLVLPVRELGLPTAHILVQVRVANTWLLLHVKLLLRLLPALEEVVMHLLVGGPAALAHR